MATTTDPRKKPRKVRPLEKYRRKIVDALKRCGLYNASLGIQIDTLASALMTRELCDKEIEKLLAGEEPSATVTEISRYGEKQVPHPVFKIQRDAQDSITRQMKQLGLLTSEIVGKPDLPDNIDALTSELNDIE